MSTGEEPARGSTGSRRLGAAAMGLSLVLFAGAIGAGFHWDDELLFRSWLPYLDGPGSVLSPPREIPHFTFQYFRPLVLVSYLADERMAAWFFPPEARDQGRRVFFHLTPVLLHVACTGGVFLLGLRLLRGAGPRQKHRRWAAFAGAMLFAVHPIHVESVAWIVGRSDSLASLLGLGSLVAVLDWREKRRRRSLLGAGVLFFLALLAKETALGVLLPALVVAASWSGPDAERAGTGRAARALEAACLVAALAAYALLRGAFGTDAAGLPAFTDTGSSALRVLGAAGWYAVRAIWPYPHAVFPPDPLGAAIVAVGAVATVSIAAGFVVARGLGWRAERTALALAVGGVAIPLAAAPTSLATSPVAERHLYLSSAGCCLLLALLLARATARVRIENLARIPPVMLLAGAVAVPWGWTASRRLALWDDPQRFWAAAAESAPDSPVVFINLGQTLTAAGRFSEAAAAYERAAGLATAPDQSAMAHANLGSLRLREGDLDAAIAGFSRALSLDPGDATSLFNWASALYRKARDEPRRSARAALLDESVARLDAALALHPRYAKAHLLLGTILLERGETAAARTRLEAAATLAPSSSEAGRARELLASMPVSPR